jgi:DNA-binding CsgD family transcriptional regulator
MEKTVRRLTQREAEALRLTALGSRLQNVAVVLRVSARTVQRDLRSAQAKLGARSSVQAAVEAHRRKLIDLSCEETARRPLRPMEQDVIALLLRGETQGSAGVILGLKKDAIAHRLTSARYALRAPGLPWVALAVRATLIAMPDSQEVA